MVGWNCLLMNIAKSRVIIIAQDVGVYASNYDDTSLVERAKQPKPECTWWRHQMETFSVLLAICAGNSPVPVNSPHKGQWRGALMFSLICVWINGWVNYREAGDLRRYRAHYDVIVMQDVMYHGILIFSIFANKCINMSMFRATPLHTIPSEKQNCSVIPAKLEPFVFFSVLA